MFNKCETEALAGKFYDTFGRSDGLVAVSVPGRIELGGNHTDHQHGRVLAASIDLDTRAVARRRQDNMVCIHSEGFKPFGLRLEDILRGRAQPGTPLSITAGVADCFAGHGFATGGFDAYISSSLPTGGGLSSSASFEVLIGQIFSVLYNGASIAPLELALIGQYAENAYFGKPSGLMDQLACALGSVNAIDFKDPNNPVITGIEYDFEKAGYALCLISSGQDHADMTADYAAITEEMREVAAFFKQEHLRRVSKAEFMQSLPAVREAAGDRAALRAMHFFAENNRVAQQTTALREARIDEFLRLTRESGRSSWMYLQNVIACDNPRKQSLGLTLALCEQALNGCGASRVHGGGFAGTALAFVPSDRMSGFTECIEDTLGRGSCRRVGVSALGAAWQKL